MADKVNIKLEHGQKRMRVGDDSLERSSGLLVSSLGNVLCFIKVVSLNT